MLLGALLELLRPRQWVKNGFVLTPVFFSAGFINKSSTLHALAAFVTFCMISSAVYIFNDWRDIDADRAHAKKKARPLPSGRVSIPVALMTAVALLAVALGLAWGASLQPSFFSIIAIYLSINFCYSLGLKQVAVLELFLVSSGLVLRLIAGAIAIQIKLSPWILLATVAIALLITTGKRRSDIARDNDAQMKRKSLNGYTLGYLDAVLAALVGATLVIYLLFSVSDYAVARYGEFVLLTAIPVAMGLLRYLQLVLVYGDGDAPTDLVTADKGLIAIVFVFVAIFATLIYVN